MGIKARDEPACLCIYAHNGGFFMTVAPSYSVKSFPSPKEKSFIYPYIAIVSKSQ